MYEHFCCGGHAVARLVEALLYDLEGRGGGGVSFPDGVVGIFE